MLRQPKLTQLTLIYPPLVGDQVINPAEYHAIFNLKFPEKPGQHENFQSLVDEYFKNKEQYQKESINCPNCQGNVTVTKKSKTKYDRTILKFTKKPMHDILNYS